MITVVSDYAYLAKGITLCRSLRETGCSHEIHYLCLDDLTLEHIRNSKLNIIAYDIKNFLAVDRNLQNVLSYDYRYFCWALASYFSNYIMSTTGESVIYIDSDIYFHLPLSRIEVEIQDRSVGIFRHRHFGINDGRPEGAFNVGVVYFKNDDVGRNTLLWWSDAVLFGKYPELATCGDQRYLDAFPSLCGDSLFIDGNIGHGAPWHWQLYDFSLYMGNGQILWNNNPQDLVFSHFSQFQVDLSADTYIPSSQHHCYTPLEYYRSSVPLKTIYDRYFEEIKKTVV